MYVYLYVHKKNVNEIINKNKRISNVPDTIKAH
jgi:uncharacterized protein YlbG (UPF0298 family)